MRPMMPGDGMPGDGASAKRVLGQQNCLVFRDKLLLPSEGFIPNHYTGFDRLRPVYVANQFGWQADRLSGAQISTASGALARLFYKQFGFCADVTRFYDEDGRPPAVMHAHFGRGGALGMPLAKALGIPLYVTFHGGDATKKTHRQNRLIPTVYQRRLAQLNEYVSGYLCVSDFVASRLRAHGFPAAKLRTHYIGIPLDDMAPPTARDRRAPLLFVGRFVEKKGLDCLVMAMRRLAESHPDICLEIAGSGPEETQLRGAAADLPQIRFLGWQTPEELSHRLATCSAMVVPSQEAANGDCEGLPTVVLEAICAGVPVIATAHAGIPEIIRDGETGLIVPERDVAALARAIKQHLAMGDAAMQMVVAAQKRVRADFDAAIQSRRLQDILLAGVN